MTLACPTCPHYADCYRDGACSQATRCASGGVDTAVLDGIVASTAGRRTQRECLESNVVGRGLHRVITERYRRALASAAANEVGACRQPETGLPQANKLAAGVLAASVALFSWGAHAAPPPVGSEDARIMDGFEIWIRAQYTADGRWCCNSADGRPLHANEVRVVDGHYEVFYAKKHWDDGTDKWIVVPDGVRIDQDSPIGMPIAWIIGGRVYCIALPGGS